MKCGHFFDTVWVFIKTALSAYLYYVMHGSHIFYVYINGLMATLGGSMSLFLPQQLLVERLSEH